MYMYMLQGEVTWYFVHLTCLLHVCQRTTIYVSSYVLCMHMPQGDVTWDFFTEGYEPLRITGPQKKKYLKASWH